MQWIVNYELVMEGESTDMPYLVINDILKEFERLIPERPPLGYKPIYLVNEPLWGPALLWPLERDSYRIGLNISDVNFNQIAFQFTQSFCRIYCDPRIHNWFIELLEHVAALYILEFLSEKWKTDPPIPELKDYHENFASYRSNLLGTAFSNIDMVKYQVSNQWLGCQVRKLMVKDIKNRGKLLVMAYEILSLFMESEMYWKILHYSGKCSVPSPPEDTHNLIVLENTEPDFQVLLNEVPREVRSCVQKLMGTMGIFEEAVL